jgi:2-succinyl-5-enolpyruvyl-6-hydroxy-3-cyclohexene-1-carboxylate synthase
MRTTSKSGISAFVNECVKHGMRHVVCSPGSRNAPLVIAFDEHPAIETFVIHDERCAAFYAMGMAQQLNAPVGITCTSGSAMLNYYPAVAEAHYQSIPLVVISADRPEEWIDQGDGQTIVQKGVYTNHIRFEGTILEELNKDFTIEDLKNSTKIAFQKGNGNWKGPIHFNVPINEPLYNSVEIESLDFETYPSSILEKELATIEIDFIQNTWKTSERKLILFGQLPKNPYLLQKVIDLSNDSSVAILVENTSNLSHPAFIHCIDRTLEGIAESEIEKFNPDLLITIGGAVVSKRIKQFLRKATIAHHWKIGYDFPEMDTYRALTKSFEVSPAHFTLQLLAVKSEVQNSMYGARWKQLDFMCQEKIGSFFQTIPYSDLSVFETILDYIPEDSFLHMGNSSVVRYCQLFDPIKSIHYFSNRGTSGIDGCTSTACGVALMSPSKCNVLITGDVSFFYDSNALWSNHLPANLRIILINNGGGGIFKIIPGPNSTKQSETFFEAKHPFKAEHICKAFGVHYSHAQSIQEVENNMEHFYEQSEDRMPKLIEITTPSELNPIVLKDFFNTIR